MGEPIDLNFNEIEEIGMVIIYLTAVHIQREIRHYDTGGINCIKYKSVSVVRFNFFPCV